MLIKAYLDSSQTFLLIHQVPRLIWKFLLTIHSLKYWIHYWNINSELILKNFQNRKNNINFRVSNFWMSSSSELLFFQDIYQKQNLKKTKKNFFFQWDAKTDPDYWNSFIIWSLIPFVSIANSFLNSSNSFKNDILSF